MASVETVPGAPDTSGHHPRLAFLSHKHRDRDLAELVAHFLDDLSGGDVQMFVSSLVEQEGPRFGAHLPDSLRDALARSGLVILIYTDPTDNWEWCLWECGVATDPRDPTPTHVEVFSFGGAVPEPYKTAYSVRISSIGENPSDRDSESLEEFARQFCRDADFWPDGRGPVAPHRTNETIRRYVDTFMERLRQLQPRGVDRARRDLLELADRIPGPHAADLLLPMFRRATDAVRWGIAREPQRMLFGEYWNAVYVRDLERLANQVLIFRPPSVVRFWERLLELVVQDPPAEGPAIRLVSGEDRADPIEFWQDAMQHEWVDARKYEDPVRAAATHLRDRHGGHIVERRFLFDERYFAADDTRLARFEDVVAWMTEAGIAVSIARRSDAPDRRWLDFAVVGDLAVSRFESVDVLANRVLEEYFDAAEIRRAAEVWQYDLRPRWSSAGAQPFGEFIRQRNGVI